MFLGLWLDPNLILSSVGGNFRTAGYRPTAATVLIYMYIQMGPNLNNDSSHACM